MPHKDIEKRREAGRKSAKKHRIKRRAYYQEYISKKENRELKQAYMKEYESSPQAIERKKQRSSNSYLKNKERVKQRQTQRRAERKAFLDRVCLHYGCRNKDCKWVAELKTYQLDFHHFDPSEKIKEVAKMESFSFERIVDEINKCIVLCKNCHADAHRGELVLTADMKCLVTQDLEIVEREEVKT